jgi:hypothetical protein
VFASTGSNVFARDVEFFDHFHRLRIDFDAPVSSVQINFTGTREFAGQAGRLEAFSADGTLVGSYDTGQLLHFEYETMTVTSDSANIAYATAFTKKEEQLTGRLDSLRINGADSEIWTLTNADGDYTLSVNEAGVYPVRQVVPQNSQQTLPAENAGHNVQINAGEAVLDIDFANQTSAVTGWQNPANALDVDNNGGIFPLDALLIINELNQPLYGDPVTGELPDPPSPIPAYFDVDDDGFVVPTDAILVINYLNSDENPNATAAAEAEPLSNAHASLASAVVDTVTCVPVDKRHEDSVAKLQEIAAEAGPASIRPIAPAGIDSLFGSEGMTDLIGAAVAVDDLLSDDGLAE